MNNRFGFLSIIMALSAFIFLVACSGGGGGGDTPPSLVGTWERTTATSSAGAVIKMVFSGSSTGGTVDAWQKDGKKLNGSWSKSGNTVKIWGGNIGKTVTMEVQFIGSDNMKTTDAGGTTSWKRV